MKRVGRAGPFCRRAFARLCKSMVIGPYFFLLENPDGISEGKKAGAAANEVMRTVVPATERPPVQDCRRRGESRRLIPAHPASAGRAHESGGQHRRGTRPEFVRRLRRTGLVRTLETRSRP